MKLLILCFNYPPDLGAGAFRIHALVNALESTNYESLEVDLITTQPNRYADLKADCPAFENHGWLRIHRIVLPSHNSGMKDQAWAYQAYVRGVFHLIKDKNFDLVLATSSRLMTAALGWRVAKKTKAPLYLDIRDLFTDTMSDLLKGSALKLLLPAFFWLEKKSFQAARNINVVSEGFVPAVEKIAPNSEMSVRTNGIDQAFLDYDFTTLKEKSIPKRTTNVLYAGNIGEGQGLHHVVPQAAALLGGQARFDVIGDGGRKNELVQKANELSLDKDQLSLKSPVPRDQLLAEYAKTDILFLHLNDHKAFLKVLPSKLFEYAATGKPIIAGVAGYAAAFLKRHVPQATVIDPCDAEQLALAVKTIINRDQETIVNDRFLKEFSRKNIMEEMAKSILGTANSSKAN